MTVPDYSLETMMRRIAREVAQEEIEKYKADLTETDYYQRMGEDM